MESNGNAKSLNACACLAAVGVIGRLSVPVCDAWIFVLFGMLTWMPSVAGVGLSERVCVMTKCPVAAVSAKAMLGVAMLGVVVVVEVSFAGRTAAGVHFVTWQLVLSCLAAAACSCQTILSFAHWHPPMLFSLVASFLCFLPGLRHVLLS